MKQKKIKDTEIEKKAYNQLTETKQQYPVINRKQAFCCTTSETINQYKLLEDSLYILSNFKNTLN